MSVYINIIVQAGVFTVLPAISILHPNNAEVRYGIKIDWLMFGLSIKGVCE